jgi:hypothetical protein
VPSCRRHLQTYARRFGTTQGESGKANLHQQWFGADRAVRHHAYGFTAHEAKITQAARNGVPWTYVLHVVD